MHIGCKTENRHDLGGNSDDKVIFPDNTVHLASKTYNGIAEDTVIHIQTAFPYNLSGINTKLIALLDMVV